MKEAGCVRYDWCGAPDELHESDPKWGVYRFKAGFAAELVEQDSRVISVLEGGFRIEIEGDRMTTWVAGDEGLIYRADS